MLPRQLDLKRANEHDCNAAWFRVATEIDVGRWSDDPNWHGRLVEGDRAMSTNHLMGEGYWVWLIRLASGATSVGIVADPAFHRFEGFNTLAKARAWLREHEPQCAAVLAEDAHLIKDFRVMKKYSHGATKVFDGRDRWCLTGDAGVFLDPLYSSGLDLVAIGNGLITDMIVRELDGEDVVARTQVSDTLFRSLTEMWLAVYQDQYTLMGTPTVMSAKVVWDIAFYWGFIGLLYMNGRFVSVADDPGVVPYLDGLIALSNRVQRFFREWAAVESGTSAVPFVDLYSPLNFMVALHTAMMGTQPELRRTVRCQRSAAASAGRSAGRNRSRGEVVDVRRRRRHAAGAGVATGFAPARAAVGVPPGTGEPTRSAATGSSPPRRPCSRVESTLAKSSTGVVKTEDDHAH